MINPSHPCRLSSPYAYGKIEILGFLPLGSTHYLILNWELQAVIPMYFLVIFFNI